MQSPSGTESLIAHLYIQRHLRKYKKNTKQNRRPQIVIASKYLVYWSGLCTKRKHTHTHTLCVHKSRHNSQCPMSLSFEYRNESRTNFTTSCFALPLPYVAFVAAVSSALFPHSFPPRPPPSFRTYRESPMQLEFRHRCRRRRLWRARALNFGAVALPAIVLSSADAFFVVFHQTTWSSGALARFLWYLPAVLAGCRHHFSQDFVITLFGCQGLCLIHNHKNLSAR